MRLDECVLYISTAFLVFFIVAAIVLERRGKP